MKYIFSILFFYVNVCFASGYIINCKGYIDVSSGSLINKNYIYIENSRILKISDTLDRTNKPIINLKHSYILPGLIDAHSHLFMTQKIADHTFGKALLRESQLSNQFRYNRAKKFLKQYLQVGFTTLFDLGNSGPFLDQKLKKEINSDPNFPTLFISGPGLATHFAQFDPDAPLTLVKNEYSIINENTDIDSLLNIYLNKQIDILKVYLDNIPGKGELSETIMMKIIHSKLLSKFKKITFHSISSNQKKFIQNFNIQNIEHFNYFDNFQNFNNLEYVTPTDISSTSLIEFNEYSPVTYLTQKNRTHYLKNSRLKILFGPDFYFDSDSPSFNRAYHVKLSISAFMDSGLNPIEIIRSLTLNPALSIKEENNIGQIKIGSMANLIATNENPLENSNALQRITFVMNKGKIIFNK